VDFEPIRRRTHADLADLKRNFSTSRTRWRSGIPRSPWQNACVERVIGSIRSQCLDHVVIFNERHLRRVLPSYVDYYPRTLTHLSPDKIGCVVAGAAPFANPCIVGIEIRIARQLLMVQLAARVGSS
jgi:hypothetical protein